MKKLLGREIQPRVILRVFSRYERKVEMKKQLTGFLNMGGAKKIRKINDQECAWYITEETEEKGRPVIGPTSNQQ